MEALPANQPFLVGYEGPIRHGNKLCDVLIVIRVERTAEEMTSDWQFIPAFEGSEKPDKALSLSGPLTPTFHQQLLQWVASLLPDELMADTDYAFWSAVISGAYRLIGRSAVALHISPI